MRCRILPVPPRRPPAALGLIVPLFVLLACGSKREARSPEDALATENPGRVEAVSEAERAILKSLDKLPAGAPQTVGREVVIAQAAYFAASGEHCRQVAWKTESRLACKDDAGWYFVPDVFGAGTQGP
jgi:hypothetical protein